MKGNYYVEPAIGEPAESQKVYCMVRKYTDGKCGLDIGCGGWKIIGSIGIDIRPGVADIVGDITKGLAELLKKKGQRGRPKKYDYIFSSHLLEDFDKKQQVKLLEDWLSFLKPGGHLILYVPEKGSFQGCNLAHKREFTKGDLEELFEMFKLKIAERYYESEAKSGYSIVLVGRKAK
jgi:SAM-dependent methyltransferase